MVRNLWFCVLGMLTAVALGGCSAPLDEAQEPQEAPVEKTEQPLINGLDNRLQVGKSADWSLLDRGAGTIAAVVPAANVNVPSPYPPSPFPPWSPVTFNAPTLKQAHNLCDGERFANEQTPATCSATLIDDDLVLTDAHCVTAANCADTRFIFNYWLWADNDSELQTLYKVFQCQSVVVSQTSPADYAIVRLDRPAVDSESAAPIRRSREPLAQGLPVAALGNPGGTLAKIASGGTVTSNDASGAVTFQLSNDGFAVGSLGSGIYYQDTGELVGIWNDPSHGQADYEPGPATSTPPGCMIAKRCPETGCGTTPSTATYVGAAIDAYCASNTNPRLCQPRNTVTFSATTPSPRYPNGSVFLEPGATIDYGTCGVPGSSAVGDTTIGLRGPYTRDYATNDDFSGCGLASRAIYTVPPMTGGRYGLRQGCFSGSCSGVMAYTVSGPSGGSFSYTATNTNNALQATQNFTVSLRQGETLIAGTCGVEDANFTGDTFLRLKSGATDLAASDDACGGLGSQLQYTAPSAQTLSLQAGCYNALSCSGTVAFTKGLSNIAYTATNTNGATQNTVDQTLHLVVGDKVTIGTCGLPGAKYSGDTLINLYLGGTRVSFNDNDCGGTGSRLLHRVAIAGDYTVRLGCAGSSSCNGNAVVRVSAPDTATVSSPFSHRSDSPPGNAAYVDGNPTFLWLRAGDLLSAGTCPNLVPGSSGTGDTILRLFGPDGLQTWTADDNCPGNVNTELSARTDMLITPDKAGAYMLLSGCFNHGTCDGTSVVSTP